VTEPLLKDLFDLHKRNADLEEWKHIARVSEALARLDTNFEAHVQRFNEAKSGAVSQDDLKAIRREISESRREMSAELQREVEAMHVEFEKSNQAWAEKILNGARSLNIEAQMQRTQETKQLGRQVAMTVFGAALSIVCTLVVFWITTGRT
jgi:uncharacterized protein YjaG (DUF416 family)